MKKLKNLSLTQISTGDDGTAWGLDANGSLFTIFGDNFRQVQLQNGERFDYISAIRGVSALGLSRGRIFFTNDGGLTWKEKPVNLYDLLTKISVGESNSAWAINNVGHLFRIPDFNTGDWEIIGYASPCFEVSAVNYSDAWVIGTDDVILAFEGNKPLQTSGALKKISAYSPADVILSLIHI